MSEIQEILFDEQKIAARVRELGGEISRDYAGRELLLVCVLKGAFIFAADLARCITVPVRIAFVQASSYGDGMSSSGCVTISRELDPELGNRHVLLADTIIDTGATMGRLYDICQQKKPASLATVFLLDKQCRRTVDVPVSYRGFTIPDAFVVGYGMDSADRFRNLPCIAVIKPPAVCAVPR